MRIFLMLLVAATLLNRAYGDDLKNRKVYECRYVEDPPYGVAAWSQSEWVKTGNGKESRFLPYNSESAKGLILDATTDRDVSSDPSLKDRETSFYMAYNAKGWYIYIHCQDPKIQSLVDERKDVALEMFFSPGLAKVPYYQMIVSQSKNSTSHFDWGMPHRNYRTLKNDVRTESLPLDSGYATFIFIPWESLYDRLPINGEHWRFSLMRWGPSVTWGGKVHDSGNFGLVHFQALSADQRRDMQKRQLRFAWFQYRDAAKKSAAFWSDDKIGDLEFYNSKLKPLIDRNTAIGESFGAPDNWDATVVERGWASIAAWREFAYDVAELRTEYLLQKRFAEVK